MHDPSPTLRKRFAKQLRWPPPARAKQGLKPLTLFEVCVGAIWR
ncbi:hypothetical protein [Mycobacterium sp.]|jgi:hypothetical protein|nr:hypothetical protein [Mycobacterium sp.]HZA09947.1 hypothetical protein [Mycobacterium sp.]